MTVDRISFPASCAIFGLLTLMACSGDQSHKFGGDMVLAISWQPGFCETRPQLPECKSQTNNRPDARQFSLHGLWPQPGSNIYCDTAEKYRRLDKSRQWSKLPKLELSSTLRQRLQQSMPGTQSHLHRHEWVKHGTCYAQTPEDYYRDSLLLLETVNQSAVGKLFRDNIGKTLDQRTVRLAFDQVFGNGAGNRVRISCRRDGHRTVITELTIGLSGEITEDAAIDQLILSAPPTRPGCPIGIVDQAGFQ